MCINNKHQHQLLRQQQTTTTFTTDEETKGDKPTAPVLREEK